MTRLISRARRRAGLAAALATAAMLGLAVASTSSGAAPPPLVGVVAKGSVWTLRPLDPRTLSPLPRGWSRRVDRGTRLVRSPAGGGVAAVGPRETLYLDSRTGRPLRASTVGLSGAGSLQDVALYWLGGERFGRRGGATVIAGIPDVSSGPSAGWSYTLYALNRPSDIAPGVGQPIGGPDDSPWAVFPAGLVAPSGDALELIPPTEAGRITTLLEPAVPEAGKPVDVAADIRGDRLFVISAGGTVAEIDGVSRTPRVSYQHVGLSGNVFESAWAGHGKIALWGDNGLGMIDTRTWKTQAIEGALRSALVTPYGIVAWAYDARSPAGLHIFPLDGTPSYSMFAINIVPSPQRTHSFAPTAVGRYLYVNLTDGFRYTVDLVTRRLVGPANKNVVSLALASY